MSSFIEKNFPTLARKNKKPKITGKKKGKQETKKKGKGKETAAPEEEQEFVIPKEYKKKPLTLPQVDLLPPALVIDVKNRALKRRFLIAGVTLVVIIVLLFVYQIGRTAIEEQLATSTQQAVDDAKQELTQYKPFLDYSDAVRKRRALASTIVNDNIPYYPIVQSVLRAQPAGGEYSSIQVTAMLKPNPSDEDNKTFSEACGPSDEPFQTENPAPKACVKISGSVKSVAGVNQMRKALKSNPKFARVYVTYTTGTETAPGTTGVETSAVVSFQGSFIVKEGKK